MTPEQAAAVQELTALITAQCGAWTRLTVGEVNALQLAVLLEQLRASPESAPRVLAAFWRFQELRREDDSTAWRRYLEYLREPPRSAT